MREQVLKSKRFSIKAKTEMEPAAFTFTEEKSEGDVYFFRVHVDFSEPTVPARIQIRFSIPCVDIFSDWQPFARSQFAPKYGHGLSPNWNPIQSASRSASGAPVLAFYAKNGNNRCTVALSDAGNSALITGGIHEKTADLEIKINLLDNANPYMTDYDAVIRVDLTDRPLADALRAVSVWWEAACGYTHANVPTAARLPMYSTWYSYHKDLTQGALLEECRLAKELGMDTVLLDDGWQCEESNGGGYRYCGDWEIAPCKFPDFKKFVSDLHAMDMKLIVWYSVPFMGFGAQRYAEFEGKLLYRIEGLQTAVLDPRYPEVRAYLVQTYADAMRTYGFDGFKLDFIDSFKFKPETPLKAEGMDYLSLEQAVQVLLSEVMQTLHAINPDVMIEFRQRYIGPVMSTYGNIFRVGDCPGSSIQNRADALNLRLLSGKTAVHTDMVMWHDDESAEKAAYQILQAFFAVPQVSVQLAKQSPRHLAMLRHYLGFFRKYQSVLLDGKLSVISPDAVYPIAYAEKDGVCVATVLESETVFRCPAGTRELCLINAGGTDAVYAEFDTVAAVNVEIFDCTGAKITTASAAGLCRLSIPDSGMARIVFA